MKKDGLYSKYLVAFIILANTVYAICDFYAFMKIGSEPAELTRCWFAFTGVELVAMCGITVSKVIKKGSDNYGGPAI